MNIVADESVDKPVVDSLRSAGHKVYYVAEAESGITDDQVLQIARTKKALLITADKDFGELVFRQKSISFGIALLRISGISESAKCEVVLNAISKYNFHLKTSFTVITPGLARLRRLPKI